jgi:hypothetical protein
LEKLTRQIVRLFLGRKAEEKRPNSKPLSKDTVRIIKMTLHGLLETAVQDGIIPFNVAHFKSAGERKSAQSQGRKASPHPGQGLSRNSLFYFYVPLTNMRQVILYCSFCWRVRVSGSVRLSRCRSAT